jgi:hypothetical protein
LNELGEFFKGDALSISQLESIYLVLAHLNEISECDLIINVNILEREILSEKGSWQP